MITNSTILFLVNMFPLSNVINAPTYTSYHCPLVVMVKEHTRRVLLYRHCLSFSLPHTHRTMKFQCTVNQLVRVLCTHYLEDSNTGVDNTTTKCSQVVNTNTQYTHICTKQMKWENKSLKPQCNTTSSTEYQSSMCNILGLKRVYFQYLLCFQCNIYLKMSVNIVQMHIIHWIVLKQTNNGQVKLEMSLLQRFQSF